jgi:hypothetical protein
MVVEMEKKVGKGRKENGKRSDLLFSSSHFLSQSS